MKRIVILIVLCVGLAAVLVSFRNAVDQARADREYFGP